MWVPFLKLYICTEFANLHNIFMHTSLLSSSHPLTHTHTMPLGYYRATQSSLKAIGNWTKMLFPQIILTACHRLNPESLTLQEKQPHFIHIENFKNWPCIGSVLFISLQLKKKKKKQNLSKSNVKQTTQYVYIKKKDWRFCLCCWLHSFCLCRVRLSVTWCYFSVSKP